VLINGNKWYEAIFRWNIIVAKVVLEALYYSSVEELCFLFFPKT